LRITLDHKVVSKGPEHRVAIVTSLSPDSGGNKISAAGGSAGASKSPVGKALFKSGAGAGAGAGAEAGNAKDAKKKFKREQEEALSMELFLEKCAGIAPADRRERPVMPLIDPETVFYTIWNYLELAEALVGFLLGYLLFIQLGLTNFVAGESTLPPRREMQVAMFSFFTSVADLVFNIFGGMCTTHGRGKYPKLLLLFVLFGTNVWFILQNYVAVYNNPACTQE
jgi:hypothetical protein